MNTSRLSFSERPLFGVDVRPILWPTGSHAPPWLRGGAGGPAGGGLTIVKKIHTNHGSDVLSVLAETSLVDLG